MRKFLLKIFYPLTVFLGKISFKRKIGDAFLTGAVLALRDGDILLSRRRWELSNLFIPGTYTHSAMYFKDQNQMPFVIEATGKGVIKTSLPKFLFSKDKIAIIRGKFGTEKDFHLASTEAQRHLGKPYDYYFEESIDAFYCSELIHFCLKKTCPNYVFSPGLTLGIETITPQDLYDAEIHFYKLMES